MIRFHKTAMGVAAAGSLALSLVLPMSAAHAEERVCRGSIGAVTLDNVRVPDGATCNLTGTKVKGTLKVESDARLFATNVNVIGNVQAEDAARVVVKDGSSVGGSIQLKQGGSAKVARTAVEGDIQYESNNRKLEALSNRVGGSIQVMQNSGGVEIRQNRVDGNLQCKENRPAPIGGGNVVQGNKEDQCSRL